MTCQLCGTELGDSPTATCPYAKDRYVAAYLTSAILNGHNAAALQAATRYAAHLPGVWSPKGEAP